MKPRLLIILFLYSIILTAQNTLVLTIEKPGRLKQIHFYTKDEIRVKVKNKGIHSGKILAIGDSAIILAGKSRNDTVLLKNIRVVIFDRTNRVTEAFSKAFTIAGAGLIGVDSFNSLINNESPVVKPRIVITGVSLIGVAILIKLFEKKRCRLGKRKKLKVIDLTPY